MVQVGENAFGRINSAPHGSVRALELGDVEQAGRASDQAAAREDQLRNGLEAAFVEGTRAVTQPLATFQRFCDRRVGFVPLKLLQKSGLILIESMPFHQNQTEAGTPKIKKWLFNNTLKGCM